MRRSIWLAVILASALIVACSGGRQADRPASSGTAPSPTGTARAASAGPVTATLREWAIDLGTPVAKAGPVTFTVRNEGKVPHDLVVVARGDFAPDRLPTVSGLVDETRVTILGRTEQLTPGDGRTLSVTMPPGAYVLICNVIGHYNSGQFAAFRTE